MSTAPVHRTVVRVLTLVALAAAGVVAPAPAAHAVQGFTVQRLADTRDRFATAASVARTAFPDGAPEVLVVNGDNPVDALGAAGFAGPDIPILYVRRDSVPAATAAVVAEFDPDVVHVAGGTGAVSDAVAGQLGAGREVLRFAGTDRYGTAALFAVATADALGVDLDRAVLARGDVWADALAATAWAAKDAVPVLLTSTTRLPEATGWALDEIGAGSVSIVGGERAVGRGVEQTLWNSHLATDRISGRDRYETAVLIAQDHRAAFGNPLLVGLADGASLVDALPASVLLAQTGSPLLLSAPAALGDRAAAYLSGHWETVTGAVVFGGTGAVPETVTDRAREAGSLGAAGVGIQEVSDTHALFNGQQYWAREADYVLQLAPARYDGDRYLPAPLLPPADAVTLPVDTDAGFAGTMFRATGLRPDTGYDLWATRTVPGLPPVVYRYTNEGEFPGLRTSAETQPVAPAFRTRVAALVVQDVTRSSDGTGFTVDLPALPADSYYTVTWCPARTDAQGNYVPPTYPGYVTGAGELCAAQSSEQWLRTPGTSSSTATGLQTGTPYEVWVSFGYRQTGAWTAYWNSAQGRSQVTGNPMPTAPSLPVR